MLKLATRSQAMTAAPAPAPAPVPPPPPQPVPMVGVARRWLGRKKPSAPGPTGQSRRGAYKPLPFLHDTEQELASKQKAANAPASKQKAANAPAEDEEEEEEEVVDLTSEAAR